MKDGPPKGLVQRPKNQLLTMILLREKEHLSDVSSWLKPFYDHLRGHKDNLKFLDFLDSQYACKGNCVGKAQ